MTFPSELTCREFISPYLIAAIRIASKVLKVEDCPSNTLSLVYEKCVYGLRASGPVDYIIMLDTLDIVLTEAKKESVEPGILQNLLQQVASVEYCSNLLLDSNIVGLERKKRFRAINDELRLSLPTYGIVSTGFDWVFSKCIGQEENENAKTEICISDNISISYDKNKKIDDLDKTIRQIVYAISNILIIQINNAENSQVLKKYKKQGVNSVSLIRCEFDEGEQIRAEESQLDQEEEEGKEMSL